ncbi:MAG: hypothetical protein ABEJ79_01985 [Halolamina sp.]
MDVNAGEDEIEAIDSTKTSVTVRALGWSETATASGIGPETDAELSGCARQMEFPSRFGAVTDLDADTSFRVGGTDDELVLEAGRYLLRVEAEIKCYLSFAGEATVRRRTNDAVVVDFPEPSAVTVGFRSRSERALETMTVPRSPAGVATAVQYASATMRTTTPDRSFPSMRAHPPLVEFGDETAIPDVIRSERFATDVELRLPDDLSYLFPSASLAYYLSADVTVGSERPVLVADGREYELGTHPTFERTVNDLLERTFFLDCLARQAGPNDVRKIEPLSLSRVGLSADRVYDLPIAERLWTYLDAPFDRIREDLPEWHLCMYVDPTYENGTVLPYLLNDLAAVYPPKLESLSSDERLDRSLDDFYRRNEDEDEDENGDTDAGVVGRSVEDAPTVDLDKPRLQDGDAHGWLAEGTPIDVFKSLRGAYHNRGQYRERTEDSISIVAVLNDAEMSDEHAEVAEIYRDRAEELDLDIAIREELRTGELAQTFKTGHDLLHFIGHCEEGGLRCPDGTLSAAELTESNVQTFFLNACGSYYEGLELIEKGSVAGAVTFNTVLDEQAALVGTMFARLVAYGYSIERALELSRRRVMMNKDYAVVGDGTHVLSQTSNVVGSEARLVRASDDEFRLDYTVRAPWITGGTFTIVGEDSKRTLFGDSLSLHDDRETVADFLVESDFPVIYDGDIHWASAVGRRLQKTRNSA